MNPRADVKKKRERKWEKKSKSKTGLVCFFVTVCLLALGIYVILSFPPKKKLYNFQFVVYCYIFYSIDLSGLFLDVWLPKLFNVTMQKINKANRFDVNCNVFGSGGLQSDT